MRKKHIHSGARAGFVTTKSFLPVEPQRVWDRCTTPEGINHELLPIMKMTVPPAMKGRTIADLPLGRKLGRSWFLLFGLIPFDYDDLGLSEVESGRFFRETSTMSSIEDWEHRRELVPTDGGTLVVDAVKFSLSPVRSMLPGVFSVLAAMLAFFFRHRHRRLARHFGVPLTSVSQERGVRRRGDVGSDTFDPFGTTGEGRVAAGGLPAGDGRV